MSQENVEIVRVSFEYFRGGTRVAPFRSIGALDRLGLIVLPIVIGEGMRFAPPLSSEAAPVLESQRALPEDAVELVYDLT